MHFVAFALPALYQNTFEFKPGMQQFGNTKAPFSSVQPATSTDSARTPDQRIIRGPMTPGSVVSESRGTAGTEAAPRAPLVWSDVLLWKEPLQTLAIFMLGLVCFSFFTFLLYGAHSMSFVSGMAWSSSVHDTCRQQCMWQAHRSTSATFSNSSRLSSSKFSSCNLPRRRAKQQMFVWMALPGVEP